MDPAGGGRIEDAEARPAEPPGEIHVLLVGEEAAVQHLPRPVPRREQGAPPEERAGHRGPVDLLLSREAPRRRRAHAAIPDPTEESEAHPGRIEAPPTGTFETEGDGAEARIRVESSYRRLEATRGEAGVGIQAENVGRPSLGQCVVEGGGESRILSAPPAPADRSAERRGTAHGAVHDDQGLHPLGGEGGQGGREPRIVSEGHEDRGDPGRLRVRRAQRSAV